MSGGIDLGTLDPAIFMEQATTPTAAADPTSVSAGLGDAAAPAPATAPAEGSTSVGGGSTTVGGNQRRVIWSPDYSSFIYADQYPNMRWREQDYGDGSPAGWYEWREDPLDGSGWGRSLREIDEVYRGPWSLHDSYWSLRDAGLWDLSDPESPTWKYLRTLGNYGDPQQDINTFYRGLNNSGLGQAARSRDAQGRAQVENAYREALEGFDPEFVDQFVRAVGDATEGYWTASKQAENQGLWKDIGDVGQTIVQDLILGTPLGAALGAYLMAPIPAGSAAGAAPGQGMLAGLGPIAGPATFQAGSTALQGGNFNDILRSGFTGGAQAYAGGAAFGPGASDIPSTETLAGGPDVNLSSDFSGDPFGEFRRWRATYEPLFSTPAQTQFDAAGNPIGSTPAMTTMSDGSMMQAPAALEQFFPEAAALAAGNLSGMDQLSEQEAADLKMQDAQNREALEAQPQPVEQSGINPRTLVKIGLALNDILGSQQSGGVPEGAPTRDEGETDEQFSQEIADYIGLDAAVLAEHGLVPGTQEYYEYIMMEADRVIAEALQGTDVDAEDFAQQLRTKTEGELLQLQRALYVRGQLDLLMGSGTYTDPFTGTAEDVQLPEGMLTNPTQAAYQRGLARTTDTLAGLRGDEALSYLNDVLGRDVDLFSMQEAKDAELERAKLEENEDVRRRRRGMLSSY